MRRALVLALPLGALAALAVAHEVLGAWLVNGEVVAGMISPQGAAAGDIAGVVAFVAVRCTLVLGAPALVVLALWALATARPAVDTR